MSAPVQLFDVPGPRGRMQQRILAAVLAAITLGLGFVAVHRLAEKGNFAPAKWTPFLQQVVWREYLIPGLQHTLTAAALAIVLAGALGLVLGLGRLSQIAPIRWVCSVVVEFFRAVPVLMMMIFLFFGYFAKSTWMPSEYGPLAAVVIALMLYNGSVIAELIRSGVYSLPKGQGEAGLSIGLTPGQTLRTIQLPQALTAMLPALIGQFVVVLKDTALGLAITYPELLTWGKTLGSAYGNTVPAYLVVGLMFILLNYALTKFAQYVERRLKRRGTTAGPVTNTMPVIVQGGAEPGGPADAGARIMVEGVEDARERVGDAVDRAKSNRDDPGW